MLNFYFRAVGAVPAPRYAPGSLALIPSRPRALGTAAWPPPSASLPPTRLGAAPRWLWHSLFWGLSLLLASGLQAQEAQERPLPYPFLNRVLDLERLQVLAEGSELPPQHFKNQSKFAARFRGLTIDKLAYQGQLFELQIGQGLRRTDMNSRQVQTMENPEAGKNSGGQSFLFAAEGGVVHVKHLEGLEGFVLYKYDREGQLRFRLQFAHTEFVQREKLEYYRPYLRYLMHSDQQAVFSSYDPAFPRSILIDLRSGQMDEFDFSAQAVLRKEDELGLEGLFQRLSQTKLQLRLLADSSQVRESIRMTNFEHPDWKPARYFESLRLGSTLYLLAYAPEYPGYILSAFDLGSGQLRWTQGQWGEAQAASHYHNLWLSAWRGTLILEGLRPEGRYLRLYEAGTGRELLGLNKD